MSMDDESEAMASQLAKLMATEVERVYKSKDMPSLNQSITHAYANIFSKAIEKGYGVNLNEIDYNSTDSKAITNLIESAYQFSAAKNYTQLRQITVALVDDQQKLRSFSDFKKAAYTITDAHNNKWLKTEYNTAIASAQMASKWQDIQANKNKLPLLQMDVIVDAQTSDICKPLEGIIKPIDDPFWATYYPPNHFACRTIVRQLAKGKITPDNEIVHPEKVPPMFKTNLAQNGMLFPKDHPYFIGVPNEVLSFGNAAYVKDTYREQFKDLKGNVYESGLAYTQSKKFDLRYNTEYAMRKEVADVLANYFDRDVYITPEINYKDLRYKYFYAGVDYPRKEPDFKIEKHFWELESYEGKYRHGKLSTMLASGCEQSDRVVIKLKHEIDIKQAIRRAKGSIEKSTKNLTNLKQALLIDKFNNVYVLK